MGWRRSRPATRALLARRLILKPTRAEASDLARLSREAREYATEFDIRRELRFNDLRGSKVIDMVWSGISVHDLAIRIGWKIETAAKMLGVYAALNPGRAMMVALLVPDRREITTSCPPIVAIAAACPRPLRLL